MPQKSQEASLDGCKLHETRSKATIRVADNYWMLNVYSAPIRGAENFGKLIAISFLETQL